MEIYGFLPVGSIERIGEFQHGYRHVVMDYYNECISMYNDNLKVEFRQNMFLHAKQPNSGRNELIARNLLTLWVLTIALLTNHLVTTPTNYH